MPVPRLGNMINSESESSNSDAGFSSHRKDKRKHHHKKHHRGRRSSRSHRDRHYVPSPGPSPRPSPMPSPRPHDRDEDPRPHRNHRSNTRSDSPVHAHGTQKPKRYPATGVAPQNSIDKFWSRFAGVGGGVSAQRARGSGKAWRVLPACISENNPDSKWAEEARRDSEAGLVEMVTGSRDGERATKSYNEAARACKAKVEKIAAECWRTNQKYRDGHFDFEADLAAQVQGGIADSLVGLDSEKATLRPMSVKRVEDIFEDPQFFVDGATANDVRQGNDGDCWLMSALCTLSNKEGLIQRICVAKDEQVGVYGFVFHRDGEWISEVIDDKLYLIKEDFHEAITDRYQWLELQNRQSPEEEYRKAMQTGSRALYFAQCSDSNETWLPLLEKAYAKAHGDYAAIEGGFVGEGIEDLTGGVTTELFTTDILDKEKFWQELKRVNKDFLFGCGQMGGIYGHRKGILEKHAYSIMAADEVDGVRLLKLRNPWGKTEWTGPWSDGSEEWTPERMNKLNHRFGDDGVFWISYRDLLRHYQHFDRTRLFGPDWRITQCWTSVSVPWSIDYLPTIFRVTLTKPSDVVIVLSQLDTRYFRGLEGEYDFELHFLLCRAGSKSFTTSYLVRSNRNYFMRRTVSAELSNLAAGSYDIHLKISATRYGNPTAEEVVRANLHHRRAKLLSIGLSHDTAHARAGFESLEKEERMAVRKNRKDALTSQKRKMHEARRKHKRKAKLKRLREEERRHEKEQRRIMEANQNMITADPNKVTSRLNQLKLDENMDRGRADERGNSDEAIRPNHSRTTSLPTSTGRPDDSAPPTSAVAVPHRRATSPFPAMQGQPRSRDRRDTLAPNHMPSIHVSASPQPVTPLSGSATARRGSSYTLTDVSDDDMSFDSEVDGLSSDDMEEEEAMNGGFGGFGGTMSTPGLGIGFDNHGGGCGSGVGKADDDSDDEPEVWNAVCVLGLRVFAKEEGVTVEVVRPGLEKRRKREVDVDSREMDSVTRRRMRS